MKRSDSQTYEKFTHQAEMKENVLAEKKIAAGQG